MAHVARKPTMRDVSRLARVSPMTVSRVFTDPVRVAEDTRARVLDAVEQLGYVPDLVAGALSSRRTNFIGLILPTLTNSNFGDTAQGLAEVLKEDGYQLLIGYTLYQVGEEERLVRALLPRRPDALVIAGNVHTSAARALLDRAGVPLVEIWEQPDPPLDCAVGFSNFEVGRAAARHLIGLGHRRIAAIGAQVGTHVRDHRGDARLKGFASMLREAQFPDDLVLRSGLPPASHEQGAAAMNALLDQAPDVEAVFAVSDLAAFGALMACHRRGVRVPDQISMMGFGNFEVGRVSFPALTTIGVNAHAIGRATGLLLRERLHADYKSRQSTHHDLPREPEHANSAKAVRLDMGFELIERETTRTSFHLDSRRTGSISRVARNDSPHVPAWSRQKS